MWRRQHRPCRAHSFGDGFAHCHTHRDGLANVVTHAYSDGFAYARFGGASDEDCAAVAVGRTSNWQELLGNGRHFDRRHRAECGWVRVRADG